MTINNRIELIISELGLNNNSFSNAIGVNPTVIHNIIKGRNAPSYDVFNKIALSFDNIDMNWLLTGNGTMLRELVNKTNESPGNSPPCRECALKDQIISSQERELATQAEFIKYLQEASPKEDGQKRKESSASYGNSKLSEAI